MTPVAAAPKDAGSGITLDVQAADASIVGEGVFWWNGATVESEATFQTIVSTVGTTEINLVAFGMRDFNTDPVAFQFIDAGDRDDWTDQGTDMSGGGDVDAWFWQLDAAAPGCQLLNDCPAGVTSADEPQSFPVLLMPLGPALDVSPQRFSVSVGDSDDNQVNLDDHDIRLGVDVQKPSVMNVGVPTWNNGLATVTFDVADAGPSGIDRITVDHGNLDAGCATVARTNGLGPVSLTCTVSGIDPGGNSLTLSATDVAGNEADPATVAPLDATAPATSLSLAPAAPDGANGYYDSRPTVSLTCTDSESGCAVSEYSIDGGDFQSHGGPVTLPDGDPTSVTVRSIDRAGNIEEESLALVYVDTLPPATTHALSSQSGGSGWHAATPTVTLSCADATSGCVVTTYSLDGGDLVEYAGPFALPDGDGVTLSYTSTDAAGNAEDPQGPFTFDVDTVAPVTTHTLSPAEPDGANGYYDSTPTVSLTCTDATSGCAGREYRVGDGEFQPYTEPFPLPEGDDVAFTYRSTDLAGNVEVAPVPFLVDVDVTPPTMDAVSIASDNEDPALARVGDTITVTYTPSEAGTLTAATIAGHNVLGSNTGNGDGTSSVTHVVNGAEGDGAATFSLTFMDVAGHTVTTADAGGVTIDTTGPALETVTISSGGTVATEAHAGDTITVAWTTNDDVVPTQATIGGVQATIDGDTGNVVVDGTWVEGPVAFSIEFVDAAGNTATVTDVTDDSLVAVDFGDIVSTTLSVADAFLPVGQSTVITSTTVWAEDPPGSAGEGDPYASGRVALHDAGTGAQLQVQTADAQGQATFVVDSTSVAQSTYVAVAIGYDPDAGQVVTEVGPEAARRETVAFTALQAILSAADDLLAPGDVAQLVLHLSWAHDDSDATGLDLTPVVLDVAGQGSGDDPRDLVPDVPTADSADSWAESVDGNGDYAAPYSIDHFESLSFDLTGGPVSDGGAGGEASTFDLPDPAPVIVHWLGAYVSDLVFANVDDPSDGTGDFVNLDDTVTATATVLYTPNYDPGAVDGLLAADTDPVAAEGATVAFFEDTYLDGTYAVTANPDALTSMATATVTGGVATLTLIASDFSQAALRDGANTYGITVLPTAVPGIGDQSITQTNAGDLDAQDALTFTALDLFYTAGSATNVDDGDTTNGGGRWWLSMDNEKGDADTDPFDADATTLGLTVTWRHDGSPIDGATVKVHDGTAFLNDGTSDLTGTSTAGTVTGLTIDPDDFGLDTIAQNLEFQAVSAPEPGSAADAITQSKETFSQEFLWTRVGFVTGFGPGSDSEVDLGASVQVLAVPVYYHDVDGDGRSYLLDAGYTLDVAVADVADASDVTLTDTALFPAAVTHAPMAGSPTTQEPLAFTVAGGCTDLDDCAATTEAAQAGVHTYSLALSQAPHGLSVDAADVEVLYTAVVLDATTDRLTAPTGTGITVTAQAFYAHTHDAAGNLLPNVGLGVGNAPYTQGVAADLMVDGAQQEALAFDAMGRAQATVPSAAAAHRTLLVDATSLPSDGSPSPLTQVFDSASMERVWLSAAVGLAGGRTDFADPASPDVKLYFDVTHTDGATTVELDDTHAGLAFTTTDTEPTGRFTRTHSTSPSGTAPTVRVLASGGALYPATYVTGEGGCTGGCWMATVTLDGSGPDQSYDLAAGIPLTETAASDVATTLQALHQNVFQVDTTAPTVTLLADRSPDAAGWYRAPVTFTASCSDATSGIASGHGATQTFSGPAGAGRSVTMSCTDTAGNVGSATADLDYDADPPTAHAIVPAWTQGGTVRFSVLDAASGIASWDAQYRVGDGPWTALPGSGNQRDLPTVPEGSLVGFRVHATDMAGNVRTYPVQPDATTTLDTTPPAQSTGLTVAPLAGGGFALSWNEPTADGAPVRQYLVQHRVAGAGFSPLETATTRTLTVDLDATDGSTHGFRVAAVDQAGNPGGFSDAVDAVAHNRAPDGTLTVTGPAEARLGTLSFSWSGLTPGPGETITYRYSLGGEDFDPDAAQDTTQTSIAISDVAHGTWTFHLRAVGAGGTIDAQPLTVQVGPAVGQEAVDAANQAVQVQVQDQGDTVRVSWTLPGDPPAPVAGVQVWSVGDDGSLTLLATIEAGDEAFTAATHEAPPAAGYAVTQFYEDGEGRYSLEAPPASGQYATWGRDGTEPLQQTSGGGANGALFALLYAAAVLTLLAGLATGGMLLARLVRTRRDGVGA